MPDRDTIEETGAEDAALLGVPPIVAAIIAGSILLFFIVSLLWEGSTESAPTQDQVTWQTGTGFSNIRSHPNNEYLPWSAERLGVSPQDTQDDPSDEDPDVSFSEIPTTDVFDLSALETTESGGLLFSDEDIETLLQAIRSPSQVPPSSDQEEDPFSLADIYAYLPTEMTTEPLPPAQQTETQRALYTYGNQVGTHIASFMAFHSDQPETLDTFFADVQNESSAQAVEQIGEGLIRLAEDLRDIENVPSQAVQNNAHLASAYEDMGEKTLVLAQARTDDDLLAAIEASNASTEPFAEVYLSLVTLFSQHDIHFRESDAGNIFAVTMF